MTTFISDAAIDRVLDVVEKRAPGRLEVDDSQVSRIRELWFDGFRHLGEKQDARLLELQRRGVTIRTYHRNGRNIDILGGLPGRAI